MPYKKPKEEEEGAATGKGKMKVKIIKGKLAKLHSAKLIKNAKSAGKVNAVKTNEKTKVATVEKNSLKLPAKDEKKRKESSSNDEKKGSSCFKKTVFTSSSNKENA
ncbi:hypothetical protein OS493_020186 [Desmophyllum pertusum]|uniref:Uncharacterized protein n=1 Tax=Desmophyllum pertusum TaxID=174260 RepID=A0A9X0A0E7_9CNID|nr:hypothetical protein OS493_020186 [Desmophyllum pertusum]